MSVSGLDGPPTGDPGRSSPDTVESRPEVPTEEGQSLSGQPSDVDLAALVRADQRSRWLRGERIPAEAYLDQLQALAGHPDALTELIHNEFLLRLERGETPSPEEYLARFPDQAEALRRLFVLARGPVAGDPYPTTAGATLPTVASAGAEVQAKLPVLAPAEFIPATCSPPSSLASGATGGPGERGGSGFFPGSVTVPGYEIEGELGRGGMGVVYKAVQVGLRRTVALKMILAAEYAGWKELERFRVEARALAQLDHPNIIRVYEVGEVAGKPYFSMEFAEEGSLAQRLAGRPVPPPEAAALVETLARAIHAAHEAGVVHRDLKPANILLARSRGDDSRPAEQPDVAVQPSQAPLVDLRASIPKISDFGLAKELGSADGPTSSSAVMGTPSYMAPEQAQGKSKTVGPAADVYALGALLYELLAGRPPFKAATPIDTVLQVLREEPVSLRRLQRAVPPQLETICLKCLEKDPSKRYVSAAALADDLRRFQRWEPIVARAVGKLGRGWRWCRRNPVVAGLLAAVALSLLLGMAAATMFAVRAAGNAREALAQKDRADEKAAEAEAGQRLARRQLYGARIQLALNAWRDRDLNRVLDLLEEEVPPAGQQEDLRGFEWYYLGRLCFRDLRTLRCHAGAVCSVAFSADGRRLASGGADGTIRIWDVATGREIRSIPTRVSNPGTHDYQLALSRDGRRVAGGYEDSRVKVWDTDTGKEVLERRTSLTRVTSVALSPDGRRLAAAGLGPTIEIFDVAAQGKARVLKGSGDHLPCLAFAPDGQRLAAADGRVVKVWDVASGGEVLALKGHRDVVWGVAFSPDGQRLASSSKDGTARVWDARAGGEVFTLRGHADDVYGVAFSADGTRLATAARDQTVRIWDAASGSSLLVLKGHTDSVFTVAFSPDSRRLASGGGDWTVRFWDAQGDQTVRTFRDGEHVFRVAFGPDSSRLATASDKGARVWDVRGGRELLTLQGGTKDVHAVAFSPDGTRLAAGTGEKAIGIWDARSGQRLLVLRGHTTVVSSVAFSRDGTRLASAAEGVEVGTDGKLRRLPGEIKLWAGTTGEELLRIRGHREPVTEVAFSPDGHRLASAGTDGTVRLWDARTGQELLTLKGHTTAVRGVSFSPDGKRLAAGCGEIVRVWDLGTSAEVRQLQGRAGEVASVAFSPDGQRLAAGCENSVVKVWDITTGQEMLSLKVQARVAAVAFSPDGHWLAAGCWGGWVLVWDATPVLPGRWSARKVYPRAVRLVEDLFGRLICKADVLEHLRRNGSLDEGLRQAALDYAAKHVAQDGEALNEESWRVVKVPGQKEAAYRRALLQAAESCRLDPQDGDRLATLGAARYRLGQLAEALTALVRSEQQRKEAKEAPDPTVLAFLAMTRHRLGQRGEAQTLLARMQKLLKERDWSSNEDAQALAREAAAVLGSVRGPRAEGR